MLNKVQQLARATKSFREEVEKIFAQPDSGLNEDQIPEIIKALCGYMKDGIILKTLCDNFFDSIVTARDSIKAKDILSGIEKLFGKIEKAVN